MPGLISEVERKQNGVEYIHTPEHKKDIALTKYRMKITVQKNTQKGIEKYTVKECQKYIHLQNHRIISVKEKKKRSIINAMLKNLIKLKSENLNWDYMTGK